MVDFDLTEEQRLLQKTAREFAQREMRPVALECGGGGIDSTLTHVIVMEELNWGCAGMATGLIGAGLAYLPIIHMGTEDQKKRFLTRFTGPEARLGALCLTEPDAGSDVANISTTAVKKGDEWVLNGVKRFITNGGIADLHVVFATIDKSLGYFGIRAFVVEHGTPGLTMGKVEDKMGVRASHTAEVLLDDCRIPVDNVLGSDEGTAFYGAMKTLESSRPLVAAGAVGIARAAYEYALDYARKRKAFGSPIAKKQAIAFMLADMKAKIDAARLLVWRAAWMLDQGMPMNKEASIAKLLAADMAMEVTTDGDRRALGLRRDHFGLHGLPDEGAQDLSVFALEAEVLGKFLVAHREQAREVRDLLLHEEIDVVHSRDRLLPLHLLVDLIHPLLHPNELGHGLRVRLHAEPDPTERLGRS